VTPRPWGRAATWLAFLGPFFFASYGFANWLTSRRSDVGVVAFPWEHGIPFVPWTIVPYWSIDLLYGLSLFVCTTPREVDRHGQRLLLVQLVSIVFFIAFPLRFSFDRPAADGFFGALFTALGSFDKPFNQAPSLHIALLVVIWVCLARHTPRILLWPLHAWMALIGISILTTYQHHFIDLPTGLLAGFFALWALPDAPLQPPLRFQWGTGAPACPPPNRRLALRYAAGAVLCVAGAFLGGAWLWLLWPATALALVALNYALLGAQGFQKGPDGRLSLGARGLLAPYLLGARINSRLWTRRHPQPSQVLDGVSIGRIPTPRDLPNFNTVVDLCAELSCGTRPGLLYRPFPTLDLTTPSDATLHDAALAIEEARQHGPVLVCCALGYSRSAAAVVAWLLLTQRAVTRDAAITIIRKARPAMVLK
jgi:protein-tyrosine phosphatase/membrane-associated phospholipid phosphatase